MGKTIILTGATSGIGKAAALEFVKNGHNLIIPVRNIQKAEDLVSVSLQFSKGTIKYYLCDLSSQKSLKKFVQEIKMNHPKIDVLINNAGIWNPKLKITDENIEETFAVNIIAPYLLTKEFFPLIELGNDKRIIFTSSGLHGGKIHFDDIQFRKNYNNFLVYQQSKLALILLTKYFSKKYANENIKVNCFHPGFINSSIGSTHSKFLRFFFNLFGGSPFQGAETLLYLALNKKVGSISGEYFAKKKIIKTKGISNNFEIATKLSDEIEKYFI